MKYIEYIIVEDKYGWFWTGKYWSIFRFLAKSYTKKYIPDFVQNMKIFRMDENVVLTWKYKDGEKTASLVKV